MERIVLDTNCLISSLKRTSCYFPIWRDFMAGKDIQHFLEYLEKL